MTDNKIPIAGIGVTSLCVLRPGDPPFDFSQIGFAQADTPLPVQKGPSPDTTYWQYQDWQPS